MNGRSRAIPARTRAFCGILAAAAGLSALTGCSGADGAEVSSVAEKYTGSENPLSVPITKRQAECRAEVYLESDLSDGAMDDVRAGKQPTARNAEDVAVLRELADELITCL